MWGRQKTVAVTVFDPGNVFVTLSTVPFERTGPLARGLQSAAVEPQGFNVINQVQDLTLTGFSADVPGIQSRPVSLAVDNLLLLASLTANFETRLRETRDEFLQLRETLDGAIRNENPNLRNPADSILESSLLAQVMAAAEQAGLLETAEPDAIVIPRFLDFTTRPTESAVFGGTYSAIARDGSLSSAVNSRVALAAGDEIALSDLLLGSQSAQATDYVLSIRSEIGTAAEAEILDGLGNPVANGTVIAAADLSSYSLRAASGGIGALDYLSIVELRDDDSDGTFEGRGAYQTVAVTSNAAAEDRSEGANGEEAIRDFRFFTESGTAFTQIRLQIDGLNSLGYTDALSAIEDGLLRVKVGETLLDGSVNRGQIDRLNSSGNTLVVVFPFQAAEEGLAQNGLDVEIRSLNTSFDIRTVGVRAEFP